eukprot:4057157-Amphidinium_carterae.1
MVLRALLLEESTPVIDFSGIPRAFLIQPVVNMLVLIIMLNLFVIPPSIARTFALSLRKFEQQWDGQGKEGLVVYQPEKWTYPESHVQRPVEVFDERSKEQRRRQERLLLFASVRMPNPDNYEWAADEASLANAKNKDPCQDEDLVFHEGNACHLGDITICCWFYHSCSRHPSSNRCVVIHINLNGTEPPWSFPKNVLVLRTTDICWASHVLAWCIASLSEVTVFHQGVPSHDNWARRDRSRKDFWTSFRSKLPRSALSLLQHSEDINRPAPACHEAAVRRSCDAFYATCLDRQVATFEKQRKLFSKVLGLYPATSS